MYEIVRSGHNLFRWLVLAIALYALVRAYRGWLGRSAWTSADTTAGKLFTQVMNVQFLLGLLLYVWLSPIMRQAFADFGAAMRSAPIRFYAVEHLVAMVAAVALVHVGVARSRKAATDAAKHRMAAIFFTAATVLMLSRIPWDRPLVP